MTLRPRYLPGSQEWLKLMAMLEAITVRGRPLDKEQKTQFRLRGVLPRLAKLATNILPDSPELLTEPVQILRMPGTFATDAGVASGPYAVHMGGGMYARQIRMRWQSEG